MLLAGLLFVVFAAGCLCGAILCAAFMSSQLDRLCDRMEQCLNKRTAVLASLERASMLARPVDGARPRPPVYLTGDLT